MTKTKRKPKPKSTIPFPSNPITDAAELKTIFIQALIDQLGEAEKKYMPHKPLADTIESIRKELRRECDGMANATDVFTVEGIEYLAIFGAKCLETPITADQMKQIFEYLGGQGRIGEFFEMVTIKKIEQARKVLGVASATLLPTTRSGRRDLKVAQKPSTQTK
jgi:hypothetical protein